MCFLCGEWAPGSGEGRRPSCGAACAAARPVLLQLLQLLATHELEAGVRLGGAFTVCPEACATAPAYTAAVPIRAPPGLLQQPLPSYSSDQAGEAAAPRMWSVRAIEEPEPVSSMHGPTGFRMTPADEPILLGGSLITPRNLSNYWHAMASCSDDVFERLWEKCYIIEHSEPALSVQLQTLRVGTHLVPNGRTYCAPTRECRQVRCRRCQEGRGGFRLPRCGRWATGRPPHLRGRVGGGTGNVS